MHTDPHQTLAILLLVAISICLVTVYCSHKYGKAHAKYVLSRVPEGEVAPPTHDVFMHVGYTIVFRTLVVLFFCTLGYLGVLNDVYDMGKGLVLSNSRASVASVINKNVPFGNDANSRTADASAAPKPKGRAHTYARQSAQYDAGMRSDLSALTRRVTSSGARPHGGIGW